MENKHLKCVQNDTDKLNKSTNKIPYEIFTFELEYWEHQFIYFAMTEQTENSEKQQKEFLKKQKRKRARLVITWTLWIVGGALILGIIAATILDIPAFSQFASTKEKIHHYTELLFPTCVGLLCLMLAFERGVDFDNIETTLEKQNITLETQNKHFETSQSKLDELSQATQKSSVNSKSLIDKVDELKSKMEPPNLLKDINWNQLITYAAHIDFLVQGWDSWMVNHSRQLEDFFKRGGKFNLLVIDAHGKEAAPVRELMKKRLEKTSPEVEAEITGTIKNIRNVFDSAEDATSQKELNIFSLNEINWYFAAQFKSKVSDSKDALVLSLYSHHRYFLKETPAIILYRGSAPTVFKWFESELNKLKPTPTK